MLLLNTNRKSYMRESYIKAQLNLILNNLEILNDLASGIQLGYWLL